MKTSEKKTLVATAPDRKQVWQEHVNDDVWCYHVIVNQKPLLMIGIMAVLVLMLLLVMPVFVSKAILVGVITLIVLLVPTAITMWVFLALFGGQELTTFVEEVETITINRTEGFIISQATHQGRERGQLQDFNIRGINTTYFCKTLTTDRTRLGCSQSRLVCSESQEWGSGCWSGCNIRRNRT